MKYKTSKRIDKTNKRKLLGRSVVDKWMNFYDTFLPQKYLEILFMDKKRNMYNSREIVNMVCVRSIFNNMFWRDK